MKIAVIGGNGYIGSRLCGKLFNEGHQVVCAIRNKSTVSHREFEVVKYDSGISKLHPNLYKYFKEPDVVIDAAWEYLDDYSHESHVGDIVQEHYQMAENLIFILICPSFGSGVGTFSISICFSPRITAAFIILPETLN